MKSRLFPTQVLLRRARDLRYPVRKPTLLKLVQDGYIDHAKRPGQGQGMGRAGLWTQVSLRQFTVWCRFRRAGLRDDRLAFALWWETGTLTPGVREFLRRTLRLMKVVFHEAIYRGHRPKTAKEALEVVRRHVGRSPSSLPAIFGRIGKDGASQTESALYAGALGLLKREPLGQLLQKLTPMWEQLSSLPPPSSVDLALERIKPHLQNMAVVMYSLAPHFVLSEIHEAINKSTDEQLSEARVYLRQAAAVALQVRGTRAYFRRIRKVLIAAAEIFRPREFRARRVPRWTKRYQDLFTWEGLAAFATFSLLRVWHAMSEIDVGSSERGLQSDETVAAGNENDLGK